MDILKMAFSYGRLLMECSWHTAVIIMRYQDCGGPMEGVSGSDKLVDRGGGTIPQFPSWIPGGSGNRDILHRSQVASAADVNEVGYTL